MEQPSVIFLTVQKLNTDAWQFFFRRDNLLDDGDEFFDEFRIVSDRLVCSCCLNECSEALFNEGSFSLMTTSCRRESNFRWTAAAGTKISSVRIPTMAAVNRKFLHAFDHTSDMNTIVNRRMHVQILTCINNNMYFRLSDRLWVSSESFREPGI